MPNLSLFILIPFLLAGCNSTPSMEKKPEGPQVSSDSITQLHDSITVAYLMGKFDPAAHPDFVIIDTLYADRPGMYLRKEAYHSFKEMHAAAEKAGIRLVIRSATRNFDYQRSIWERKWNGKTLLSSGVNAATDFITDSARAVKILEYSAMPGTSRHHWGTEVDLNSFENSWFEHSEGLKLFEWMLNHALQFGYCRPYTRKDADRPYGYNEEKWHWSYFPVAGELTDAAEHLLSDSLISGFDGAEVADEIRVVKKYVLGISSACK